MDDADTLQAASMAAPEAGAAAAAAPAAGGAGAPGDDEMVAETEDKKPRRIGLIIIGIVFGGFGLWAVTAPLDSAALAPGTVTVEGHRKAVQHLQGGIVKEILVREGQTVQSEEPLLILDDTQARAELGIVTGQ
jgi:multidrug resistance efflux pump